MNKPRRTLAEKARASAILAALLVGVQGYGLAHGEIGYLLSSLGGGSTSSAISFVSSTGPSLASALGGAFGGFGWVIGFLIAIF